MAEFKNQYKDLIAYNAGLFALSADKVSQSNAFKSEMGLPFTIICDEDRSIIRMYDLYNAEEHDGIAFPSVFIFDRSGVIRYRSLDRTYNRVDLSEITSFLVKVNADPEYSERSSGKKRFVAPTPASLLQLSKNMVMRGDSRDWTHYLKFMLRPILRIFKSR